MECRIAAAIQSTTDCGCNNKLIASTNEQAPQPLHQHQLKNYTVEFYNYAVEPSSTFFITELRFYKILSSNQLSTGFCNQIFQPPQI